MRFPDLMDSHDVSLSIVTYNNRDSIATTLTSLLSHTARLNPVIYVIDNCSRDDTLDCVEKLREPQKIRIIRNRKNIGFGAAHNLVIDMLDSRYHLIVNPDITIEDDSIYRLLEFMESNDSIGLVSPQIRYPSGEIQYLCKRNPTFLDVFIRFMLPHSFRKRQDYYEMRDTHYDKVFKLDYASGCFMFFRTEIFKRLGGFDRRFFLYFEDADITRRVNQVSQSVFFPGAHVVHTWARGSHNNARLMAITMHSVMNYFGKWGFQLW